MVEIISVVIGDHFSGGDHFDGGDHFGGGTSHPPCEHSRGQHLLVRKITQSKTKTLLNELNVHAT